jgi:hypothetical protein
MSRVFLYGGTMELPENVLISTAVAAAPLVVVLVMCGVGYAIVKRGRPDMIDSPWFWGFAFSAMGLLGVWAISGKYDDRQKRLEARTEARQRIAEQPARSADPAAANEPPRGNRGVTALNGDSVSLQYGYSQERKVPLRYLAGGLSVLAVASAFMLWRELRKTSTVEPHDDLAG